MVKLLKNIFGGKREVKSSSEIAKDPVCGMNVDKDKAAGKSEYMGKMYYFCAPGCKKVFDENPEKYLNGAKKEKKHSCCGMKTI